MQYCPIVMSNCAKTNKQAGKIRQENNKLGLLVVQIDATLFITIRIRYRQKLLLSKTRYSPLATKLISTKMQAVHFYHHELEQ